MSDHAAHAVERHCDVVVIGGSAAALAAALRFGRQRRSVIVVDAGDAPTEPAGRSRTVGPEGVAPSALRAIAREEVRSYGVEVLDARAVDVTRVDDGRFRVDLVGGHTLTARRVVAADGAADEQSPIDELVQRAGASLADDGGFEAPRAASNQADWDHRYGRRQMWSGNPNGALVHEITGVHPGRALDVGAGEGGDAIWLAEQGWRVVASDISRRALDRIREAANERGLVVECLHADANALGAFEAEAFHLVTAHYGSIPRTPDDRAITNVLGAVAPGGVLLVVGHDLEPMRQPIDTSQHSRAFDPDAYVRVDDFAAAVAASADWRIEVHEKRGRPTGHAAASHHVDDVVLRARRITP
jgi:SAM-dependent methyltransferase